MFSRDRLDCLAIDRTECLSTALRPVRPRALFQPSVCSSNSLLDASRFFSEAMANWGSWQSSASSSSWGNRNQWQSSDWSEGAWQQHNLTRIGVPQLPAYQFCLHRLLPTISITTKRPSAKEPMSCTKKCNQLNGPVNPRYH